MQKADNCWISFVWLNPTQQALSLNFKCSGIFFFVDRQCFTRFANICTGLQFRCPLPTFWKSSKSAVRAWRSSSLAVQLYMSAHIQALSVSQRSIPTHRHGRTSACSRGWLYSLNMSTTERILWRLGWVLKWRGAIHDLIDESKRCPNDPNRVLIKRIIALEGDTVKTRSPCPEPEIKIPQGHVWVEGVSLSSLARPKLRAGQRRWIFSYWWQQLVWTYTSGSHSIEAYQNHLASGAFWPSQRTGDSWKS